MLESASQFRVQLKRLYELYLKKYEEACVWREHERAISYQGNLNALEHILIDAGEGNWVNTERAKMEDHRNQLTDLWRKIKP